jgi:phenylalanyl-tRNA synthetase beta chain
MVKEGKTMATVEFSKAVLEQIIGKKLTEADYHSVAMFGCPLERIDKQTVCYEIFPNRPDLLSHEGLGRALRTFWLEPGLRSYTTAPSGLSIKIEQNVQKIRPAISAAYIRGVKLTSSSIASLIQFQEKLAETVGRKRAKAAIGIHDGTKIKGPLTYKAVKSDAKFLPLEATKPLSLKQITEIHPKGLEYRHILTGQLWPVIVDRFGHIISFPPIINSKATQITTKTTELFIEVTGTNQSTVDQITAIIATSLAESGAKIFTVNVEGRQTPNLENRQMALDIDYVNKLLDLDLTPSEIGRFVAKMGFGWDGKSVTIPPYRVDVMHPIDIVEDIAIAIGYQNFEPRIPKIATIAQRAKDEQFKQYVKNIMTSLGFQEVVTMILSNEAEQFKNMAIKQNPVCIAANPLTKECTICRPALLPSLLKVFSQNRHYELPQKIFEIGDVVTLNPKAETGADNFSMLSAAICDRVVNYNQAAATLDVLMREMGINYSIRAVKHPTFIDGRTGAVFVGKIAAGFVGEIAPTVLLAWGLENPVIAFEINMSLLMELFYQPSKKSM